MELTTASKTVQQLADFYGFDNKYDHAYNDGEYIDPEEWENTIATPQTKFILGNKEKVAA